MSHPFKIHTPVPSCFEGEDISTDPIDFEGMMRRISDRNKAMIPPEIYEELKRKHKERYETN